MLQKSSVFCLFVFFFLGSISSVFGAETKYHIPSFCNTVLTPENPYLELMNNNLKEEKTFYQSYIDTKQQYHTNTNQLFNAQFEPMTLSFAELKNQKSCIPLDREIFIPTADFFQELTDHLQQYECTLLYFAKDAPTLESNTSIYSGIQTKLHLEEEMRKEVSRSNNALIQTIELYNEMRTYYPIHRDMSCLIYELEQYRDALRNFIDQIVLWPSKFYNYGSYYQVSQ